MVNPLPFYRSRMFWLGIPVLLFLLWGWWHSMQFLTLWAKKSSWGDVELESFRGSLRVNLLRGKGGAWRGTAGFYHLPVTEVNYIPEPYPAVPRYVTFTSMQDPKAGSAYHLTLAHWFLISLYAAAWGGAYVMWQRRKRRLMKSTMEEG